MTFSTLNSNWILALALTPVLASTAPALADNPPAQPRAADASYKCTSEQTNIYATVDMYSGNGSEVPGIAANVVVGNDAATPLNKRCSDVSGHGLLCVSNLGKNRYEIYPHVYGNTIQEVGVIIWSDDAQGNSQPTESYRLTNCSVATGK